MEFRFLNYKFVPYLTKNMNNGKINHISLEDVNRYIKVDYLDGDIAFITDIRHIPKFDLVKLEAIRMLICVKGSLQVSLHTGTYTLHANEVLYCGPNALTNDAMGSEDLECWGMFISTRTVKSFLTPNNDLRDKFFYLTQNPVFHIKPDKILVFELYRRLLVLKTNVSGPYRKETMTALTYSIFYELLANVDNSCVPAEKVLVRQGDILFKRFIELLLSSKVKVRSVSYYADKLFVTTKYLSAVCKQACGKTAFRLINELVMEDITEYLKYSEKSIKEIAVCLDFPSISFFGKFVRAHTGMSPTEYKKLLSRESLDLKNPN